jgi:hypothetical protein
MRFRTLVVVLALAVGGCSHPGTGATPSVAPPSGPAPSPSPSRQSGFCLDLDTFQFAVVTFRAEAGEYALSGKAADVSRFRRSAMLVDQLAKEMAPSAPADIRDQFTVVVNAIAKAAALLDGSNNRLLAETLYGSANAPAFDAVEKYDCVRPSRTA